MGPLAGMGISTALILSLVWLLGRDAARSGGAAGGATGEDADSGGLYRVVSIGSNKSADADFSRMLPATVSRVVDGDTLIARIERPPVGLEASERVRLIGVDTPESVDPRQPVERFGKEASDFASSLLEGKAVRLAFDRTLRDQYGRLLAYVYAEEGLCANVVIVERGYGFAYLDHSFHFQDEFRAAQQRARKAGLGLWAEAD